MNNPGSFLTLLLLSGIFASPSMAQGFYGGGLGAGYGGYLGSVGGYMYGLGALTEANAGYQIKIQEARVQQQVAERERIKSRLTWEESRSQELELRMKQVATRKDFRETVKKLYHDEQLNLSRSNPEPHYIQNGFALNMLLAEISRNQLDSSVRGAQIPIDMEMKGHLHINDSGSASGASLTYILPNGKLDWPAMMETDDFEPIRIELDKLAAGLVTEIKEKGKPAPTSYKKFEGTVEKLQKYLDGQVSNMSPHEFIYSNRFVSGLEKIMPLLLQRDAKKYFDGTFSPKAESVGELVEYMLQKGLKFGPASDIDRAAYEAFYRKLLEYDTSIRANGGRR